MSLLHNINKKSDERLRIYSDMFRNENDHKKHIDRINLERGNMFGLDTKTDVDNKRHNVNKDRPATNRMGEITGNDMDDDYHNYDQGMPIRSQYTIRKPIHDPNAYTDFDIFKKNYSPSIDNIKYYDPHNGNKALGSPADIMSSMSKMSNQVAPNHMCSSGISMIATNLFNHFKNYNSSYAVNAIGLYNIFAALYLSSDGLTEVELKQYFNFPKREHIYDGIINIIDDINSMENIINSKNLLIMGHNVPYDMHHYDNIKDFCILFRVNINKPSSEAARMNHIIKKLMLYDIRNPLIADNIANLQLMFLNLIVIKPIWEFPFDKIIKGKFISQDESVSDITISYLYSVNKSFSYYEDNIIQLAEINCQNNSLSMGIILPKSDNFGSLDGVIDESKLKFYISNLKDTILDEFKIPVFKQDLKMRYVNVLKSTGLTTAFTKIVAPDLLPESGVLHDVVQNVSIIVDNNYSNSQNKNSGRGYRTTRKFIANKSFIYYFRLLKSNTIVLIGSYY